MFCAALDPEFVGLKPTGDPDGSAKLLGQGPIRMIDYWKEVKRYMVTALPQPQRGPETEFIVVGGNLLCLGATRTPVANIGLLVRETHTFNPDKFIACRGATLEDIASIVEDVMNPYKSTMPGVFSDTESEPDGSAKKEVKLTSKEDAKRAPLGMYPGTIVVVLDGQQFIQPTPGGDFDVAPMSDQDRRAIQRIAASLAYSRSPCVILPPQASKYGVKPIFDVNTAEMASILKFHGIVYYQPEMWNEMRMYNHYYPMDTTSNRRLYTRLFQLLLRLLEWYASVRDKYCANDMLMTGDNNEITCMFKPHNMDPTEFTKPEAWRKTDACRMESALRY
jgi:hypothetical protein